MRIYRFAVLDGADFCDAVIEVSEDDTGTHAKRSRRGIAYLEQLTNGPEEV